MLSGRGRRSKCQSHLCLSPQALPSHRPTSQTGGGLNEVTVSLGSPREAAQS